MSQDWFPKINNELCKGCNKCFERCRNSVLKKDEDGAIIVANPENCVENCWACYTLCRNQAIVMPKIRKQKIMGCNACGRTPCRFGARGMSDVNVKQNLLTCQGMAAIRMQQKIRLEKAQK